MKMNNILQENQNRLVQPPVNSFQNQFGYQWNTPGFCSTFDYTYHQYQNPYQQTTAIGWNGNNSFYNYQHFPDNRPSENYYPNGFNFLNEGYQFFDENHQSSNNKRPRECYNDDGYNNCGSPIAKTLRITGPLVEYAIKRFSYYPQPMRKVLDSLFESEITADGWEKSNDAFQYHTTIRGKYYCQLGSSIVDAKEQVAETALKDLCSFKFENISWPRNLLSFRLEQSFADAIEMLVCL